MLLEGMPKLIMQRRGGIELNPNQGAKNGGTG